MTTQEYLEEPKLSYVTLKDDGFTIWLNGESEYSVRLPMDISRKKAVDRQRAIETTILNACNSFEMDYVSIDNIQRRAKEIVDLLYERERARRAAVATTATGEEEGEGEGENGKTKTKTTREAILLTEDLTKEVSLDYIAEILSTSIKKDKAPKVITFNGMLLAQTNDDQLNIGFQAESSAGKSWIPIEVSNYFPSEEVQLIASASPTAFYHDGGEWDSEEKTITKDLQYKNLIFLDMNSFQLLEKLRPMLSHDKKELRYMITDKNQKYGLRTKNVIIRGYPSVFFCSTRTDPDEQEKTRMILLSPSTDQEKLRESIELAAMRKGNPAEWERFLAQDPNRKWLSERIYLIRQWGIHEIIIADYKAVCDRFLREHKFLQPRHQRDFPRIMSFIKAHALLNCFKRERPNRDTILANQTDIDAGFALYKEIEQSNELGLSPYIHTIYQDVIAPMFLANGCVEGINGVLRDDIAKQYFKVRHKMLSPEALKNILLQLETVGLIKQEPDPENKRRIIVYPTVSSGIS